MAARNAIKPAESISDNNAGWVDATVTVEIIPEPNIAPQVSPANYDLQMEAGETVTVDFNHPLAGLNLTFEVEVTDVRDATDEEKGHGHAHGPGGHEH